MTCWCRRATPGAVYKIERRRGRCVWRLGGLRSDFALGPGVRFAWQHDARWLPDGTISVFDNQATPKVEDESTAAGDPRSTNGGALPTVVRELTHPDEVLAIAEGNAQAAAGRRDAGRLGARPARVRARRGRRAAASTSLLPRDTDTYRAFRHAVGRAAGGSAGGRGEAFGRTRHGLRDRWNGATEVTRWELLAGAVPDALRRSPRLTATASRPRSRRTTAAPWFAVRALAGDRALGTSAPVRSR